MTDLPQTVPRCTYKEEWTDEVGYVWVCRIHGQNSKHDVDGESHLPCLEIDPYDSPEEENYWKNIFDISHSEDAVETYGRNPIEGIVNYPKGSGDIELRLIQED